MKKLTKITTCFLILWLAMIACQQEETVPGQPPTVNAGPDLMGTVGNPVALVGTASDPDGDALTYQWRITAAPAGSAATINDPNSLLASLVPDVVGSYTLQLSVSDGNYDPVTDDLVVTVEEALGEPPVAQIRDENGFEISEDNENHTVALGSSYVLDGSDSYDPEDETLAFAWEVTLAPDDADYTLTESSDGKAATFAPRTPGDYTLQLTVTDTDENADTAAVTLVATAQSILISQNITEDTVWTDLFADPAMPDYIVQNNIDVSATLVVEPGVVVQLQEDVVMTVASGGALTAEGNAENRITFTSSDVAGEIYWGGLLFESSSANNALAYTDILYGGGQDRMLYEGGSYRATSVAVTTDARLKINHSTIAHSESDGLFSQGNNTLTELENNTFRDNGNYPLSISINQAGVISATNTFEDNPDTQNRENRVRIYDSSMDTDQEWAALGGDASYVFVGNTEISARLTINPGAHLEFDEGVYMTIASEGAIIAQGTSGNEIVFTSTQEGEGRNWGGILVNSASTTNMLDYVQIQYAGGYDRLIYDRGAYRSAGLAVGDGARLAITNAVISHSAAHGLYMHTEGSLTSFGNNQFHDHQDYPMWIPANQVGMVDRNTTFTDNPDNVVAVFESTLDDDARFTDEAQPVWVALAAEARYLFTGSVDLTQDLILSPGAFLMFAEETVLTIESSGSLTAVGTADSTIVLTAYQEDGNNNWGGLAILSDNGNQIRFARVSYAGGFDRLMYDGGYHAANIGLEEDATLTLTDTQVTHSKAYGLAVDSEASVNGKTPADADAVTSLTETNTFEENASGPVLLVN